jgi:RNA polymerase sigma-70 factor (ECF subfamily)
MNHSEESLLFEQVKQGNIKTFEVLFHRYYGFLCTYAEKFTQDKDLAEEIVQDFFVGIWEKKEKLKIDTSVQNYFYRSVKNRCLNFLQHQKTKDKYAKKVLSVTEIQNSDDHVYTEVDLAATIEESINSLPEKRREIFRLSRQEGLKYTEIAKKLNISIKTVETHMSLAINSLRDKLTKYKSFFLFF